MNIYAELGSAVNTSCFHTTFLNDLWTFKFFIQDHLHKIDCLLTTVCPFCLTYNWNVTRLYAAHARTEMHAMRWKHTHDNNVSPKFGTEELLSATWRNKWKSLPNATPLRGVSLDELFIICRGKLLYCWSPARRYGGSGVWKQGDQNTIYLKKFITLYEWIFHYLVAI